MRTKEQVDDDEKWLARTGGLACDSTLRDYFASLALQALMTIENDAHQIYAGEKVMLPKIHAKAAYFYADAMLAEREKTK